MTPVMPQSHSDLTRARRRKLTDAERLSASKRGYGRLWQRLRLMVLHRDPICKMCNREPSNEVDHIIPRADGGEDTMDNLQGACKICHSKKTMREVKQRYGQVNG